MEYSSTKEVKHKNWIKIIKRAAIFIIVLMVMFVIFFLAEYNRPLPTIENNVLVESKLILELENIQETENGKDEDILNDLSEKEQSYFINVMQLRSLVHRMVNYHERAERITGKKIPLESTKLNQDILTKTPTELIKEYRKDYLKIKDQYTLFVYAVEDDMKTLVKELENTELKGNTITER